MRKLIQLLVVAIVGTTSDTFAQNGIYAGDALRFSRTDYSSSARFKGMGNAQMSLGGDVSSVGGNPAGLGMFTRSEVSITPEFNNIVAQAGYLGQDTRTAINRGNVNHSAFVWYFPGNRYNRTDLTKRVKNFVMGFGVNRTNDFGAEFNYGGTNRNSSIANMYAEQSNGFTEDKLTGLPKYAQEDFLTRKISGSQTQYVPATSTTDNDQYKNEIRWGSTSEFNFAGAINLSDKLYLGVSINYVFLRYRSDAAYYENGVIVDTKPGPFETNLRLGQAYDLKYSFYQETTGSGINGRLGMVFKPTSKLRIGATFQTPTWLVQDDYYDEDIKVVYSESGWKRAYLLSGPSFDYNLRTPYKGSFGASIILGQNALLTADIDYVDYSSVKLSARKSYVETYDSETDEYIPDYGYLNTISDNNLYIRQYYAPAVNYRIGGEYKINNFSLRAGYGVNGSPYKDDTDNLFAVKYYSGGLGYRIGAVSVDLAYQRTETTNTFSPYELNDFSEPIATVKLAKNNVFLTVGVRF